SEKDLDGCLEALGSLDQICIEKFADSTPGFGKLKSSLEEVRHTVHAFLQKKRETEPDPVEPVAPEPVPEPASGAVEQTDGLPIARAGSSTFTISLHGSSEPADRQEAVATVANAAALLRRR